MNYLKKFQNFIIFEAAKKIQDIISDDNICLYIHKTESPHQGKLKTQILFVFYDSSKIDDILASDPSKSSETVKTIPEGIIGNIKIERYTYRPPGDSLKYRPQYTHVPIPFDCFSVLTSGINKDNYDGWGPALYDLVIQYCGENGLRPSRNLSSDSTRVWNFYFQNRPDIEKRPIDPVETEKPLTPDPTDDGVVHLPFSKTDPNEYPESLDDSTYMNHVYFFKGSTQYDQFVKHHETTLLKMKPENRTKFEHHLEAWGLAMYINEMNRRRW